MEHDPTFGPVIPMERDEAFPMAVQGRWVAVSDPSLEVIVDGSEITWRGVQMDYQVKTFLLHEDGRIWVKVEFMNSKNASDTLDLMVRPDCDIYALSDQLSARLIREHAQPRSGTALEPMDLSGPGAGLNSLDERPRFRPSCRAPGSKKVIPPWTSW